MISKGWASSYKFLRNGSRQIVNFHIPGDFLGLRSILLRIADHSIEPVTPVAAAEIDVSAFRSSFQRSHRLARSFLWVASTDEAMVVERFIGVARRNAFDRTAHLLLELGERMKLVGLGTNAGYDCPLTQYHLADALGLTAIHVNRVLRQLRERGFVTFRNGRVTFHGFDNLASAVDYNTAYLDYKGSKIN